MKLHKKHLGMIVVGGLLVAGAVAVPAAANAGIQDYNCSGNRRVSTTSKATGPGGIEHIWDMDNKSSGTNFPTGKGTHVGYSPYLYASTSYGRNNVSLMVSSFTNSCYS